MLEKIIFLLLGTVAAHIKVCPVHTSVLYDLSYQCDAVREIKQLIGVNMEI
jgi:hypothetical protein